MTRGLMRKASDEVEIQVRDAGIAQRSAILRDDLGRMPAARPRQLTPDEGLHS